MTTPEARARIEIDKQLEESDWVVQDRAAMNLYAGQGVAVRYFQMATGHGEADYLLFVDQQPVGALEAKPVGHTLSGVEIQTKKYSEGLPERLDAPVTPLPFLYESTGAETQFTNLLDPVPRSRPVFAVHRPETIVEWLSEKPLATWASGWQVGEPKPSGWGSGHPATVRGRIQALPDLDEKGLWPNQKRAVRGLEASLADNRPRSLLQMATGSGKTFTAVTSVYRLIKYGGARRVLFLVDRSNLAEQAEKEFANYRTPDDGRKFTELYNVQRLTGSTVGSSSKVVICTIQRLYSILKGEEELPEDAEEGSQFDLAGTEIKEPAPVVYNAAIPPEFFDVVFVDECHRSIYSLWRQVLEYFDCFLVGLTATPAAHTFGFFKQNLVMEYRHEEAVADGVNVDFEVYRIRTKITEEGGVIASEPGIVVPIRDRKTRERRWETPDEDIAYTAKQLDSDVVAMDQIRTVIRTFRDRLFTEIFPGRKEVPKTLVFAKDDSHAEDVVRIFREEFAKGNDFAQKITYKTTGAKPADLIQAFRNDYFPRIAVTVDMVATGTDIKPVEIVMFLRSVKSRTFFEQMKGRGVRVIDETALTAVTPDARKKTHFVIVDCVGVCEREMADTHPLERKKSVTFRALLQHVAQGGTDADYLSSLASRISRLHQQCTGADETRIRDVGDCALTEVSHAILQALDPDRQESEARTRCGVPADEKPTPEQIAQAAKALAKEATKPLAANPALRTLLEDLKKAYDQYIDETSQDELIEAGASPQAREKAKALVQDFETFLRENKDEVAALEFFYAQPHSKRLRYKDVKALAAAIEKPPRSWATERIWNAYATLDASHVRGGSMKRVLTDIVSLVRFALHQQDELAPFPEQVRERFDHWVAQQGQAGREFTEEQRRWLEMMRDHVEANVEIGRGDFQYTPFAEQGGLAAVTRVFGTDLSGVLSELNEVLAA